MAATGHSLQIQYTPKIALCPECPESGNSQGDIEIIMQATGEPGWHFSDLYPAIYKGQERRPNNYRLPQLTYADDHPGEDLPRFRFAFEVTPDGSVGQGR